MILYPLCCFLPLWNINVMCKFKLVKRLILSMLQQNWLNADLTECKGQFVPCLHYSEIFSYLLSIFSHLRFDTRQGSQGENSWWVQHLKRISLTLPSSCYVVKPVSTAEDTRSERKTINLDEPDITKMFTYNMFGVERTVQTSGYYRIAIWSQMIFMFLPDIAIQNAWTKITQISVK